VGIAVLYGATLSLVLGAWIVLLKSASKKSLGASYLLKVYALFQLLKYAPTNVLHHVGRYAMLRRQGVDAVAVAWSTFAEAVLVCLGAIVVSAIFGMNFLRIGLPNSPPWPIWALLGAIAIIGATIAVALRKSAAVARLFTLVGAADSRRAVALTVPVYALFFVATGAEFWLMAQLLPGDLARPQLGASIGAIAAAWLFGFITPGAPGGIGIRESIIVLALGTAGNPVADGVLLAACYRIVTILGDGLFAVGGYLASQLVPSRKFRRSL
jgi:hypothetical protein